MVVHDRDADVSPRHASSCSSCSSPSGCTTACTAPMSGSEESTQCELQRLAYQHGLTHWQLRAEHRQDVAGGCVAQVLRHGSQPLHPVPALHPRLRRDRGQPHAGRPGSRRAHDDHRRRRCALRRVHLRLLRHLPPGLPDRRADRPPQRLHGRPGRCAAHTRPPAWPARSAAASRRSRAATMLLRVEGDWDAANGGLLCVHGRFEVVEPQAAARHRADGRARTAAGPRSPGTKP